MPNQDKTKTSTPSIVDGLAQAAIELSGVACLSVGAFMVSPPAGYITTGAVLIVAAIARRVLK